MLRERGFSWRALELLDTAVVTTVWVGDFRVARALGKWKVVIHGELLLHTLKPTSSKRSYKSSNSSSCCIP
jgi:hypothetical protein